MTTNKKLTPLPLFPPQSPGGHFLLGVKRIAAHLNAGSAHPLSERQVRYLIERGGVPTFRIGAHVCSTPALIDEHFRKLASEGISHERED